MCDKSEDSSKHSSSQTTMRFSYKSAWDHARCLFTGWKSFALAAIAVFGVLWGLAGAWAYFLRVDLRGWHFFVAAILVSLVAAAGRGIYVYLNACPLPFESESRAARKIAQLQRPKWEFRLAKQLLADRLGQLDNTLEDLLEGRVFVPIEKRLGITEYCKWAAVRPENLMRMVKIAMRLFTVDLPASLKSVEGQLAEPKEILHVVKQIQELYAASVEFERGNRTVAPPEALEKVHVLQFGWTNPVRNGIHQILDVLDDMSGLDPTVDQSVTYQIEFQEAPNVDEYCEELDRLTAQLPNLLCDDLMS